MGFLGSMPKATFTSTFLNCSTVIYKIGARQTYNHTHLRKTTVQPQSALSPPQDLYTHTQLQQLDKCFAQREDFDFSRIEN